MRKTKLFSLVAAALLTATTAWADVAVNGKLPGAFSVSATKVVYFSQGNLQYKASNDGVSNNPTWRFAAHQYDYIGNAAGNTTSSNRDKSTNWIDLFGWATSGWNNGNRNAYQPYSSSTTISDYGVAATKSADETLTGDYANGDWGVYNSASLGSGWRTLTKDEWVYLFNTRTTSGTVNSTSNARYTEAKILTDGSGTSGLTYNICGIILFPDDFDGSGSYSGVTWGTINGTSAWGTTCTTAGWAALEDAGCVFLPAAGYSNGTPVYDAGSNGRYWSSTAQNATYAYCLSFKSGNVTPQIYGNRCLGLSVRLVSETAPPTPATVTAAPTAKSLTYNGSAQALVNAGTASGGTMNYSLDNSTWSTSIPTATNADNYTVYYKVVGDASHTDYTPSPNTVAVTISQAALSITADNKSVTYGDAAPTYTASYSGFMGGETASVLSGTLAFACEYAAGSNVGGYTITPSGVTASNYDITFNTGTLTVNKAASSVTAAPTDLAQIYTGNALTLINAGTATGGTMWYKFGTGDYSTDLPTATNIGDYTVYYKVVGDDNHNDVAEASMTASIIAPTAFALNDDIDNTAVLGELNGETLTLTINRTLSRDGYYSTLCLPFDLDAAAIPGSPLEDFVICELTAMSVSGDMLYLEMDVTDGIEAGKPYLVRYAETPTTAVSPLVFNGVTVTVSAGSNQAVTGAVMHGILEPTLLEQDNENVLFLAANNTLKWNGTGSNLRAFRAYFTVTGSPSLAPVHRGMSARIIEHHNAPTDIETVTGNPSPVTRKELRNGQLIIIRGEKEYNAQGQTIK